MPKDELTIIPKEAADQIERLTVENREYKRTLLQERITGLEAQIHLGEILLEQTKRELAELK